MLLSHALAAGDHELLAARRNPPHSIIPWKACLNQETAWYAAPAAIRIAGNVLLYQLDTGAWPKNIDMARPLSDAERDQLDAAKSRREESTIDNGATFTQIRFLSRVYAATRLQRFRQGASRGIDFLLNIQYPNGGLPQFPDRTGYPRHITFNDNAMIGVLELLQDVARSAPPFAWVDAEQRHHSARAVEQGIQCILDCQVIVDGMRTVWCAQHNERTLEPAPARSYELVSLSGSESVGIVRFLMSLENPSPGVAQAIEGAIQWFNRSQLREIRLSRRPDSGLPKGFDVVVEPDPGAPPVWARFYEIDTNRPFFCGRDGIKKYRLEEIEQERRVGYSWYTTAPARLLARDYPAWRTRRSVTPTAVK